MSKSEKTGPVADRRSFMKLAGAGVVSTGAALVEKKKKSEAATPASGDASGYRETDHVRRYYELAKFI